MAIPFIREFDPAYGQLVEVPATGPVAVRRVVANNPGAFTAWGTGTYVIGRGKVAVVDPGPADEAHIAALLAGLSGETVTHILVTHTHIDHSPGARLLQAQAPAPTHGYGPHGAGKLLPGEEVEAGGDRLFKPDMVLRDGDIVRGEGWTVSALHTPGHTSNHLCFALHENHAVFTGDHVMGWSTTVISPPDGDMADYMASLDKLAARRDDQVYYPTHGAPIRDPLAFVASYRSHRLEREAAVLAAVAGGTSRIVDMVKSIYKDVDNRLHPAAARSVLAHLTWLAEQGKVRVEGELGLAAGYFPMPR
jgi:glyoxylase-like metal-dependent hydrolase (beta-lactamase superfamily II)